MTKVLNLDNLADAPRELVIAGRYYKVKGMTVASFIAITKAAEKLDEQSTFADQVNATIETIRFGVPDIERETLMELSLEQLKAVIDFVRGEEPEGAKKEVSSEEKKD